MGRKVYTVKGSEDGVIGVFSNKKAAFHCAYEYAKNNAGAAFDYLETDTYNNKYVPATYQKACASLKGMNDSYYITSADGMQANTALIQTFNLESGYKIDE